MKKILSLVLAGLLPLLLTAQVNKPGSFTDKGKTFIYTDTGGITATYITHFGSQFSVDSMQTPGGEYLLLSPQGQVTVYNFWYVACKTCIPEIPALNQLVEKYKGEPVQFIAITFDKAELVETFLQKTPFNFMIGILPQQAIDKIKKVSYYPFTAIVNKNQKLSFVLAGKPVGKNAAKEVLDILDPQISKALKQ